jgi:hypothetical protein
MPEWNPQTVEYALVAAGLLASWLVYTVLLWLMIKIQRLNCHFWALLGSSALAVGLNQVPVVGAYVSVVVLLFCLWKATGAALVPDVVFTVVIAGALMFCVNLWVLGAAMGRLRPTLEAAVLAADAEMPANQQTNQPADHPARPKSSKSARAVPPKREYDNLGLSVRGILLHVKKPTAMISWANGNFQLSPGENCSLETRDGLALISCQRITEKTVTLLLGEKEQLTLSLH